MTPLCFSQYISTRGKIQDGSFTFNAFSAFFPTGRTVRMLAGNDPERSKNQVEQKTKEYPFLFPDGLSIPKDEKNAFFWGLKAAEQDYPGGQIMVGTYYEKGMGVEQDYAEAAKWFRKAADQGNEYAQYELGEC